MANVVFQKGYYNGIGITVIGLNVYNQLLQTGNLPIPRDGLNCTIVSSMLFNNLGSNTSLGTAFFYDAIQGSPFLLPQSIALSPYPGMTVMVRRHTTFLPVQRDQLNIILATRLVGGTTDQTAVLESSMVVTLWQ